MAEAEGYACYALSFAYGQRHSAELQAAKKIAQAHQTKDHLILNIDLGRMGGSALTDNKIDVPEQAGEGIPNTYVPARNTVFLSYALAWAEVLNAEAIYIGVNAVDYSGYPDCRPEYIEAFQAMAGLATKAGVEGQKLTIETPLIHMSKAEIIQAGTQMGIDYSLTVSCYQADAEGLACGVCESCRLRKAGFEAAGLQDPTRYQI
jgi:7-cyano-7-deazaguanine synthase